MIVTDCASVKASGMRPAWAIGYQRPMAGWWLENSRTDSYIKTKAHRQEEEATEQADWLDYWGNWHADFWAKRCARKSGPAKADIDEWKRYKGEIRGMLLGTARIMEEWPCWEDAIKMGAWVLPKLKEVKMRTTHQASQHQLSWHPTLQRYVCGICLTKGSKKGERPKGPCKPSKTRRGETVQDNGRRGSYPMGNQTG